MAKIQTQQDGNFVVEGVLEALGGIVGPDQIEIITKTSVATADIAVSQGSLAVITQKLADMASDAKLTPDEKKELLREWEGYETEKPVITDQADDAGLISTDAPYADYLTAYNALDAYLTGASGLLLDITTTSDIVAATFRAKFTDYIQARQNLQSAIQGKLVTKAQTLTGFTGNGGTLTPTAPTLAGACMFSTAHLTWDRQTDLTGIVTHNVYRSDALAGAYSLLATVNAYQYTDSGLTLGGTEAAPEAKNWYYRVSRLVNGGSESSVSNTVTLTANPIPEGNIEAGAITAGKIDTGVLNALIANIASYLTISSGTGFTAGDAGTTEGDRRTFLDQDEIRLQEYRSSAWVNMLGMLMSGEPGNRFASMLFGPNETAKMEYSELLDKILLTDVAQKVTYSGAWVLGSWGAAGNVETVASSRPSILVLPDNSVLCVYVDSTTGYLRQKIRDIGGTWGNYSVIESDACYTPSLTLLSDGSVLCLFTSASTNSTVEKIRSPLGIWGDSTSFLSPAWQWPALTTLAGDEVLCVYMTSINDIVQRVRGSDGVWSDATNVETDSGYEPALVALPDGRILCLYRTFAKDLVQRIRATNGTWGAASNVETTDIVTEPAAVLLQSGALFTVYLQGNDYLRQKLDTSAYTTVPIGESWVDINGWVLGQTANGYYLKTPFMGLTFQWGSIPGAILNADSTGSFANYTNTFAATLPLTATLVLHVSASAITGAGGYGVFCSTYSWSSTGFGIRETSASSSAANMCWFSICIT